MIRRKGFSLIETTVYIVILSILMLSVMKISDLFYQATENVKSYNLYNEIYLLKLDLTAEISNSESIQVTQNRLVLNLDDSIIIYEIYDDKLLKNNEFLLDIENGYFYDDETLICVYLQNEQRIVNFNVFWRYSYD
ncbi:MAG: prepilin-type N-terminal cleavage/methylation domain-containing protein [Clostridia bacterium]